MNTGAHTNREGTTSMLRSEAAKNAVRWAEEAERLANLEAEARKVAKNQGNGAQALPHLASVGDHRDGKLDACRMAEVWTGIANLAKMNDDPVST